MKIAIAKGNLQVPPTYFAITHAERMKDKHDFQFFTLNANVATGVTELVIRQATPGGNLLGFDRKNMFMPLFEKRMAAQIRRFDPDVIHQHFATWSNAAVSASRATSAPLIVTVHGADVHLMSSGLQSPMAERNRRSVSNALKQSKRVLAVSKYLADKAMTAGADPKKVEIHYQGIDTDVFFPGSLEVFDAEPQVLFVGNHSIAKGARDVFLASVQAYSHVAHKLIMVGGGPLVEELRSEALSYQHIEVLGSKDRSQIRQLLQSSTVFMSASQLHNGWTEAAGLVNLEAQACGLPVVGYANGGIPEMVSSEASTLVEEGDITNLGHALTEALQLSRSEQIRTREAARRFAVDERSLQLSCQQLDGFYNDVLAD
ncbi:glycosyltransferase [Arthrobacter sp. TMP15]|uniref:glycosyltransferase n=1 Tax=Arthrobacter sp. TMP15 TaxID=3140789 RepID=UPI0031BB777A